MTHVVVLGAGLGGVIMAYEMKDQLAKDDRLTVITKGKSYSFVPSNPWVAVGWRERDDIEVDLTEVMEKRDIALLTQGAARVHPAENRVELTDGASVGYDYLVIATGPDLAFDEIEGLGPDGHTQSVCHVDHALQGQSRPSSALVANPGPVIIGAVQGASCFGPAYEFLFILETALRKAKVRDRVPMTFVTSEPYIGHLGLDGVGDTKGLLESEMRGASHQVDHQRQGQVRRRRDDACRRGQRGRHHEKAARPALRLFDDAAGLPRRPGRARDRGSDQPARLHPGRQASAQPGVPERLCRGRRRRDPADGADTGAGRRAEDRLHDRKHGDGDSA